MEREFKYSLQLHLPIKKVFIHLDHKDRDLRLVYQLLIIISSYPRRRHHLVERKVVEILVVINVKSKDRDLCLVCHSISNPG